MKLWGVFIAPVFIAEDGSQELEILDVREEGCKKEDFPLVTEAGLDTGWID